MKSLLLFFLILFVTVYSVLTRTYNINYNSPFNDEAIYIVIGRLGIFQGDWYSYNANSWIAGLPYLYPVLTALAYVSGGIIGSRLLSVALGIICLEAIFVLALLLSPKNNLQKYVAALITTAICTGAPVYLYVSRLATFDICSFSFFFLGLVFLLGTEKINQNLGKTYFLSTLFFLLSFFAKIITAVYFPLVVLYSFYQAKKIAKNHLFYWKRYFLVPLIVIPAVYGLTNLSGFLAYTKSQVVRNQFSFSLIFQEIWTNTTYLWFFWGVGSLGMWLTKQKQKWLYLTIAAFWILAIHLMAKRYWTLDKHLFLTVAFFSLIAGVGISSLIWKMKGKILKTAASVILAIIILLYWRVCFVEAQKYNSKWANANKMLNFLTSFVNNEDKVLTETGAATILAIYGKNSPFNTITFDWFKYGKKEGITAYTAAARDGYFNIIELEGENMPKESWQKNVSNSIRNNLGGNYTLVFSEDDFFVYKRNF